MKFDIKRAFKYMTGDKKLVSKVAISYLLLAFPAIVKTIHNFFKEIAKNLDPSIILVITIVLLFCLIISLMCQLIYFGYYSENVNLRISKPEEKLPQWYNLIKYIPTGFKSCCGALIYSIFIFMVAILIIAFNKALLPLVMIFALFFLFVITNVAYCSFLTDLKFGSFFNFKKIKLILIDNFLTYIKYLGWAILLGLILGISFFICIITIVGVVLMPLIITYFGYVINDLCAQMLSAIIQKTEAKE